MIKKLFIVMVGLLVLPMIASATVQDLTAKGASWTDLVSGAIFTVPLVETGGAGTGNIDAFVGIQGNGQYEQGYNTGGTLQYDTKAGTHTHPLSLAAIQNNIVKVNGINYYEFLLDVNETTGNSVITLVDLEIYVLPGSTQTGYPFGDPDFDLFPNQPTTGYSDDWSTFTWATPPYDYGEILYNGIAIDYNNYSGSGWTDMIALIPLDALATYVSSLDGTDDQQYVYLYSVFGTPDAKVDDGFEEWARTIDGTVTPPENGDGAIPEPGTLILLGSGLAGLAGYGKLRFRRKRK